MDPDRLISNQGIEAYPWLNDCLVQDFVSRKMSGAKSAR